MKSEVGRARHRSREVALQVLFALDVRRAKTESPMAPKEVFDEVAAQFEMPEAAKAFAKELVCGVADDLGAIDERLRARVIDVLDGASGRIDAGPTLFVAGTEDEDDERREHCGCPRRSASRVQYVHCQPARSVQSRSSCGPSSFW